MTITKFSADGCPKCRMLAPIFNRLAIEFFSDGAVFLDCDIDKFPQQAAAHNIQSVPVVMVEVNGREIDRIEGIIPEPALRRRLAAALEIERRMS